MTLKSCQPAGVWGSSPLLFPLLFPLEFLQVLLGDLDYIRCLFLWAREGGRKRGASSIQRGACGSTGKALTQAFVDCLTLQQLGPGDHKHINTWQQFQMGENTHTQLYFTLKIHRKIIIHGTLPELLDFFYIILDHVANFLISFTCKATADKKKKSQKPECSCYDTYRNLKLNPNKHFS